MSSLAESFLADLEDIEEEATLLTSMKSELPESEEAPLPEFPTLLHDPSFQEYMESVRRPVALTSLSLAKSDQEFLLIEKSNTITPLIDSEISTIHKYVVQIYSKRFPELDQIVLMSMDYLRVVHRLVLAADSASSSDLHSIISRTDFSDFLPNNISVTITVTGSTSNGVVLTRRDTQIILSRIQTALSLDKSKLDILNFLQNLMPLFAPNITALLGPFLAAQLVSSAGGITSLATMPSQNIESVGSHKRSTGGLSSSSVSTRVSLISSCDLVTTCPVETRKRAVRLVLGKAAICARVDQFGSSDPSSSLGQIGEKLRQEIVDSLIKTNEPPPARAVKPLPIPQDLLPKKTRRGGARARRFKEKYALTETQKQANRMQFGSTTEVGEIDGDIGVVDRGMIGMEIGEGRIRQPQQKKQKIKNSQPQSSGSLMDLAAVGTSTIPKISKNDLFSSNISF